MCALINVTLMPIIVFSSFNIFSLHCSCSDFCYNAIFVCRIASWSVACLPRRGGRQLSPPAVSVQSGTVSVLPHGRLGLVVLLEKPPAWAWLLGDRVPVSVCHSEFPSLHRCFFRKDCSFLLSSLALFSPFPSVIHPSTFNTIGMTVYGCELAECSWVELGKAVWEEVPGTVMRLC